MLINSKERLETLLEAQREIREVGDGHLPPDFYRDKIARLWARAAGSRAYAGLGRYSWDAFRTLPVTPKERFKSDPWSFATATLQDSAKYYQTTGTTGAATPAPRLAEDIVWNAVSVALAWRELMVGDARVVSLLPSDIVPVGDLVASVCEFLDIPHVRAYPFATGICDWDRMAGLWETLRPTAVFVAPGVALQATRLFQQRGLLPAMSTPVRSLMLLGEVSVPALRARLGGWWGATAYDASYGSTETGTLAAACPHDRLHLLTATNHLELATGHGVVPVTDGGTGRLVVTPLNLFARPLLRYDTGDEVTVSVGCACGRPTPWVTVLGRATDGVRVQGAVLSPHAVEEIVYRHTTATGYLLDVSPDGSRFRLLLERGVGVDRGTEPPATEAVRTALRPLDCDQVAFVNALPSTTKSGGSQKSWKRSNIRTLEEW
jgi:phenylacetate-CoA ligase